MLFNFKSRQVFLAHPVREFHVIFSASVNKVLIKKFLYDKK
jgi:hypothetical protein